MKRSPSINISHIYIGAAIKQNLNYFKHITILTVTDGVVKRGITMSSPNIGRGSVLKKKPYHIHYSTSHSYVQRSLAFVVTPNIRIGSSL